MKTQSSDRPLSLTEYIIFTGFSDSLNLLASQKTVLCADEGEPIESVVGAGAGVKLRGPTHRAGNHFPGELWINVLGVGRASLENSLIVSDYYLLDFSSIFISL